MTEATVFVVDDDPGALESLRWMLAQADFPVKAFRSGQEFLDAYNPDERGCLVLDMKMPELDGLAVQNALRDRKCRIPIIFLTAYGNVPTCARAFRNGATDFLEKPVDDKVLLDHIGRIMALEQQRQRDDRCGSFGDRLNQLTSTEADVLDALVQGRSIKEIARARKVSVQTIWRHQVNVLAKIGVENHLELIRVATQWQVRQEHDSRGAP
jgi:two-component system, LuxR family, response regulator FixJ